MKLLFVGGTSFVGRHAVEAAVAAGHEVTVFHRGRTNDDLLAGSITHRHGDRNAPDYSALADATRWDAVIDVSAYVPRHVHQLADAVAGRTGHYVHISSISAYDDELITPHEDSPLNTDLADPTVEDVTNETYGPLKAMCERAGQQRFGEDRTAVIRPTYVAGPHDSTDRFTYWARRMGRGGDVAIVGPGAPLQIVDGRDLGAFILTCAESGERWRVRRRRSLGADRGIPGDDHPDRSRGATRRRRRRRVGGSGNRPAAAVGFAGNCRVPLETGGSGQGSRTLDPSARRDSRCNSGLGRRTRRARAEERPDARGRSRAAGHPLIRTASQRRALRPPLPTPRLVAVTTLASGDRPMNRRPPRSGGADDVG